MTNVKTFPPRKSRAYLRNQEQLLRLKAAHQAEKELERAQRRVALWTAWALIVAIIAACIAVAYFAAKHTGSNV